MALRSFLYLEIVEFFIQAIEQGTYSSGDKLPSLRQMMREKNISQATATRVMVELETRGYVTAKQRSGFVVSAAYRETAKTRHSCEELNVPDATVSSEFATPVNIQSLTTDLFRAFAMPHLIALGAAEIEPSLLPATELAAANVRALRKHGAKIYEPRSPFGIRALRQGIARLMSRKGMSVSPEEIIITAGETDAMALALRAVTKPGDTVAVESPTFFGILQEIELAGLHAIEIATDPHRGIDVADLNRVADDIGFQAVILNPVFENPFGFSMPPDAMRAVAEAMALRGIPVIEDDVYSDLGFHKRPIHPLASFDPAGNTIYCASFSKTLSPGLRIGWCLPGRHRDNIRLLQELRPATVSILPQYILADYLSGRRYMHHLNRLCEVFSSQQATVRQIICDHFPIGTTATAPEGGFLFWIEVPPPFDAMKFYYKALSSGISIAPGPIFSSSGRFKRAFRISVGRKLTPNIVRALQTLGQIAHME